jgi:hypothetical protein
MAKREMVEAHVEKLLKRITGKDDLSRDSDGDWPFALNRAFMYVRVSGDTGPTVRVVGVAAHSVAEGPELFAQLNEINNTIEFSRAFWQDGTVFVTTELVGESLDIEELDTALQRVSSGADFFGPKVVEKCGGETPTPASPPPASHSDSLSTSGYL